MPELYEILGPIRNIEVIASGRGVKVRDWLRRTYGGSNWRKLKGFALVCDTTGEIYNAEIHWFECHGGGGSRSSALKQRPAYAICVEGYAPFLQVGRAYKVLRRLPNDPPAMLRVIDGEGEDYLYPQRMFVMAFLCEPDKQRVSRALAACDSAGPEMTSPIRATEPRLGIRA